MPDIVTITQTSDIVTTNPVTATVDVGYSLPGSGALPANGGTMLGNLNLTGSPPLTIAANAQAGYILASDAAGDAAWVRPGPVYDQAVEVAAPAAWWKLADVGGSTTVLDSSGNSHAGTATSVTFGSTTGPVSSSETCAQFTGSPSGILTTYAPTGYTAVSVEAWVNTNGNVTSGARVCATSHTDVDTKGFQLWLSSGTTPKFAIGTGSSQATAISGTLISGAGWHHLVGVWNGTTITLYMDGVSVGTASISGTMAAGLASGASIGYGAAESADYYKGFIGQVAVYSRALSAAEVAGHYAAVSTTTTVAPAVDWLNVKNYGAAGNGVRLTNVAMASGSTTLTSSGATFTAADVGKAIVVLGAGNTAGDRTLAALGTTIAAVTNSTTITLSASCSATSGVTSMQAIYGTDDTVAIKAALAAVASVTGGFSGAGNENAGGQTLYFPYGLYMITSPLTGLPTGGARITGAGQYGARIVTVNCAGISDGFAASHAGLEIDHLSIEATGGHCVSGLNLTGDSHIHNVRFVQNSAAYSVWDHNGSISNAACFSTWFTEIRCIVYGTARTVPGWNFYNMTGAQMGPNVFERINYLNDDNDNNQYAMAIGAGTAAGATNGQSEVIFRDCSFSNVWGGAIALYSCSDMQFHSVSCGNFTGGQTPTNSSFYVGPSSGARPSSGITFNGCGVNTPPSNSGIPGVSWWDIQLDSTTDTVLVNNFAASARLPANGGLATSVPYINVGGASNVVILCEQASAVISNPGSDTIVVGNGKVTVAGTQYPVDWLNVKMFGAKGDGQRSTTASMTASSATLTNSTSVFVSTDVGKLVMVDAAGASGVPLAATISAYISGTQVTLSAAALTTVSSATLYWGTDDAAAIRAALNAANTTFKSGDNNYLYGTVQPVYFPYACYMVGSALTRTTNGRALDMRSNGAVIVAPQSTLYDFQINLVEAAIRISGFCFDAGGGHILANANVHGEFYVSDCNFTQRHPNYSWFYMDDVARADGHSTAFYQAKFERVTWWQTPGTRSIEMFHIVANSDANINNITFEKCFGPNPNNGNISALDNTQFQFLFDCEGTGTTGNCVSSIVFRDITTGNFFGGFLKARAVQRCQLENFEIGNTYAQQSTNSIFDFGPNTSTGSPSTDVEIKNIRRTNGFGPGSSHTQPPYDVTLDSTCINVKIQNYTIGTTGNEGPFLNIGGASQVIVECNGSRLNDLQLFNIAGDTIVITNGGIQIGGQNVIHNADFPGANGLAFWNYDPVAATSSGGLAVNGSIYVMRVDIKHPTTFTKLWWYITTAGVTATTGENWAGLYNSSGTLLASAAADSTYAVGAQSVTVSSTAIVPGLYYVALLFNGATPPTIARSNGVVGMCVLNTTGATLRFGINGTGATTMPSTLTLSSNNSGSSWPYWVGGS